MCPLGCCATGLGATPGSWPPPCPNRDFAFTLLDRLKHFMEETPIDRLEPEKYQISNNGYGWHGVYYQPMLPEDEFAAMSVSEGRDEVRRRLEDFMDPNESDYKRINDYFRCLAFRPDVSTSTREESS